MLSIDVFVARKMKRIEAVVDRVAETARQKITEIESKEKKLEEQLRALKRQKKNYSIVSKLKSEVAESARQKITEIESKEKKLEEQLRALKRQKKHYRIVSKLKSEGGSAWSALPNSQKWKKEHVLSVIFSRNIPHDMTTYPLPSVGEDLDILLALSQHASNHRRKKCERNILDTIRFRHCTKLEPLLDILKVKGENAWERLMPQHQWDKQVVLAVFENGNIPLAMEEPMWLRDDSKVPLSIRDDRDILLARMKRKYFASSYKYYSSKYNAAPFRIPEQHLNDEEVVAAAASSYPEVLLQSDSLPAPEVFDSKEVFLSFVKSKRMTEEVSIYFLHRKELENCIGMFSTGLLSNADLMLKAAPNIQHGAIFTHFSGELSDDCAFALQLAQLTKNVPDSALERFSKQVKADPEVVLTLVQRNGLCLKDADETLKRNPDLVLAACKENGTAILHCAPETRQAFSGDRNFMLEHVFRKWTWKVPRSPELYKNLTATLKLDRDIIVAAAEHKNLSLSDLPEELMSDHSFWMDVVQCKSSFWLALPQEFEDDPAFASAIEDFEDSDMVHGVFRRFPFLRRDRDIWLKIVSSDSDEFYDEEVLSNLIQQYAPATGALCQDSDFAVLFYSTEDAFYLLEHESPERIHFLHTVLEKAEEKIEAHEGFTEAFVYGMTANAGSGCHLPMLARDKETSVALKEHIMDYLGVPKTIKERENLQEVISNLDSLPCYCGMCHEMRMINYH